jgi:hypothetical protein
MNTSREKSLNTWFNHVYLLRLFNRMLYASDEQFSNVQPHLLRYAKLKDGSAAQADDPVVDLFLKAIESRPAPAVATFGDLKIDLRQWLLKNHGGPATYNHEALDAFFAMGAQESLRSHLDAIFKHMCGSTLSGAMAGTQVLYDHEDPGLHGSTCYSLDLELASFDFPNFIEHHRFVAMASSLERLLPLVDMAVKMQGVRSANFKGLPDNPLFVDHERKLDKALPSKVLITKNGEHVLSADIRMPTLHCPDYVVAWENAIIKMNDQRIVRSLHKAAPGNAARMLKGRMLEDGLGL